jgi:hypothetical protein
LVVADAYKLTLSKEVARSPSPETRRPARKPLRTCSSPKPAVDEAELDLSFTRTEAVAVAHKRGLIRL